MNLLDTITGWFSTSKGQRTNLLDWNNDPFGNVLVRSGYSPSMVRENFQDLYAHFTGLGKSCMEFRATNEAIHKQIIYKQTAQTDIEEVDINHPAVELLNNMNPQFTNEEIKQQLRLSRDVLGIAYFLIIRNNNGYPKEFWNLHLTERSTMTPKFENGLIARWEYKTPDNKIFVYSSDDIIAFPELNPANPYSGIGKIEGNPYVFKMEETLNIYQKEYIENDATGKAYIKLKAGATKGQRDNFIKEYNQLYKGYRNAGKMPALADADIVSYGSSNKDLDFVNTGELFDRRIIATFRVHPQLLGLTQDVNKSNGISALSEWHNVHLIPMVNSYDAKMTKFIRSAYKDAKNFIVKTQILPPNDREMTLKELELDAKTGALRYNQYLKLRGYDPIYKLDSRGNQTKILDPLGFEFITTDGINSLINKTPGI